MSPVERGASTDAPAYARSVAWGIDTEPEDDA